MWEGGRRETARELEREGAIGMDYAVCLHLLDLFFFQSNDKL